jgi:hypothetical protein
MLYTRLVCSTLRADEIRREATSGCRRGKEEEEALTGGGNFPKKNLSRCC